MAWNPKRYGPAFEAVVGPERLMPLGPGRPDTAAADALAALSTDTSFDGAIRDRAMADACIAAAWLYHDFLDESHTISQSIETPTGSYWHGIMHRREPDASNAGYWFRRVRGHEVFEPLRVAAADLAAGHDNGRAAFLTEQSRWDPFAFIDLCESVRGRGDATEDLCRRIQLAEWRLLFDWCWDRAVG